MSVPSVVTRNKLDLLDALNGCYYTSTCSFTTSVQGLEGVYSYTVRVAYRPKVHAGQLYYGKGEGGGGGGWGAVQRERGRDRERQRDRDRETERERERWLSLIHTPSPRDVHKSRMPSSA